RIARYLLGRDRQRAVRDDTSWFERARQVPGERRTSTGRRLRLIRTDAPGPDAVPVVDLRVAAGALSEGQNPEPIGFGRVEGLALRPGLFIAQVVGDSMNEIAPQGAWCVWEHLGVPGAAPPAPGQNLLVRRADVRDAEFGEYTFKHL